MELIFACQFFFLTDDKGGKMMSTSGKRKFHPAGKQHPQEFPPKRRKLAAN